jgi:transposase-like protein
MANAPGADIAFYTGPPLTAGSIGPDFPIWFVHPVNAARIAVDAPSAALLTKAGYAPYSVAPQNCRLRYRLTLRDLSEIMLLRGFTVSRECVRQWEAKLLPVMGEALRQRRHGTGRRSGQSGYVDETYLKVHGRRCYLYRAIDRDGNLIGTMLSATRDMRAAQRFFRSARSVAGFVPDRVTTDGHNSYPRAIRSTLGRSVRHRTSVYLNNRLNRTIAGSRDASDVCAASRSMTRPTGSAESTMNSETSSAADPVTTNTFLQPGDAVTSSTMHASRSASCRSHDQKIHGALRRKRREA